MGKLNVTGHAKREVTADVVKIELEFMAEDKNATKALLAATEQCEAFLGKLHAAGFDLGTIHLADDSVEHDSYSDDHEYAAMRKIEFKMPLEIKSYNAIVDMIRHEQYDISLDTEYLVSNIQEIREELMQAAVLDSQRKAEKIAAAMKKKVVGCKEANLDRYYGNDALYGMKNAAPVCDCEPVGMTHSNKIQNPVVTEEKEVNVTWLIE